MKSHIGIENSASRLPISLIPAEMELNFRKPRGCWTSCKFPFEADFYLPTMPPLNMLEVDYVSGSDFAVALAQFHAFSQQCAHTQSSHTALYVFAHSLASSQ